MGGRFEQLAQALLYAKPDDPKAFLVSKLQTLRGADDLARTVLVDLPTEIVAAEAEGRDVEGSDLACFQGSRLRG